MIKTEIINGTTHITVTGDIHAEGHEILITHGGQDDTRVTMQDIVYYIPGLKAGKNYLVTWDNEDERWSRSLVYLNTIARSFGIVAEDHYATSYYYGVDLIPHFGDYMETLGYERKSTLLTIALYMEEPKARKFNQAEALERFRASAALAALSFLAPEQKVLLAKGTVPDAAEITAAYQSGATNEMILELYKD
jgi:hypothetical protein